MSYRMSNAWHELSIKEQDLARGRDFSGFGDRHDSMGRPVGGAGHFNHGSGPTQLRRVERVHRALADSGPMAQRKIGQRLSNINVAAIWDILISACEDIALYYGATVVAGAFLGGIVGATFGGVGALPGAAAGMSMGSYAGGWVLAALGLKSLVEGVVQAIPNALRCYEEGFREAWGPTWQDHRSGYGGASRGEVFFAASSFADGHIILMSAILAVFAAYLTKGKVGKDALLADIRNSPRLGPKVATWVEKNEKELQRFSNSRSPGRGALPQPEESLPQVKRERSAPAERKPYRIEEMPKKKVPCFTSKGLPQGSVPEFDRQLAGQEAGINNMTVDEYINGRDAFESGDSTRDRNVARQARVDYQSTLQQELENDLISQGIGPGKAKIEAARQATDKMKTLAALHNPDMVAGGQDVISDFGDRGINSRIGSQWNKGQRLAELDKAAADVPGSL